MSHRDGRRRRFAARRHEATQRHERKLRADPAHALWPWCPECGGHHEPGKGKDPIHREEAP